jgi:putative transposase
MLQRSHRNWVMESCRVESSSRDSKWSESIAMGDQGFVAGVKKQLGTRTRGRKIMESAHECQLRETSFLTVAFLATKTAF